MNNTSPLAFALGAVAAIFITPLAYAEDGALTFSGQITASTCTIKVDDGAADQQVKLPPVGKAALAEKGQVAGATPIHFTLSDCTTGTKGVAAHFNRANSNIDRGTGNLKNTNVGETGAKNVEIQLLDGQKDSSVINLAGSVDESFGTTTTSGEAVSASLLYFAQYYATAAATAGNITSVIEYELIYE